MKDMLKILNPWWKTGSIKKDLAKGYKRDIFNEILKFLDYRLMVGLYGLRRTGKSTLFFQIIDFLLNKKVEAERILYFSFDEKVEDIKEIFSDYTEVHSLDLEKGKYYVFFDEIQKLGDWSNKIKIFYDMYPNIKFFVSGSAQLLIRKKVDESLGGRIKLIKVEPLSFREWLSLNKFELDLKKINLYSDDLKKMFGWFGKTPFPEIADCRDEMIIKSYISEMVVSKVLSYDIPKVFKDADLELLETLKNIFFDEPGFILNFDSLAKDLGRSKEILIKHVFYLEQAMLIRILRNYRGSTLSSSRKLRRVYPYHPALVYLMDEDIFNENLFVSLMDAKFYWREKEKEIDMVKEKKPIEIKSKEKISSDDLKNSFYFMDKFKQKEGIIISKSEEKEISKNSHKIKIIPTWKGALLI